MFAPVRGLGPRARPGTGDGQKRTKMLMSFRGGLRLLTLSHYKYTKLFQYSKNKLLTIKYLCPFMCLFIRVFKTGKT